MTIEKIIRKPVSMLVTGRYVKGSSEPFGYDEIDNLRVYVGDVEITNNLSISEKIHIEEIMIASARDHKE